MKNFLELRTKLVVFYQKTDYLLKPLFKFLLTLTAALRLRAMFNYDDFFSTNLAVLLISVIAAFIPMSMTLAILVVYASLLIQPVSVMMSMIPLSVYLIFFCFFLRLIPEYSCAVIAMPVLILWKLPYVIPMAIGLFATPVGIIPTCAGVLAYYLLNGIKADIITIESVSSKENPVRMVSDTLNDVLKNEKMYALMAVFVFVIIVMFLVRNIKMDYSFEISIAIGASVLAISLLILLLRTDMGMGITEIIIASVVSGIIIYISYLLYRPLFYAGTERVRFEDDDYYYYVRAIPKIKILGADNGVGRKLVIDPSLDDEEDEEEAAEEDVDIDENIFGVTRTADDEQDDF